MLMTLSEYAKTNTTCFNVPLHIHRGLCGHAKFDVSSAICMNKDCKGVGEVKMFLFSLPLQISPNSEILQNRTRLNGEATEK